MPREPGERQRVPARGGQSHHQLPSDTDTDARAATSKPLLFGQTQSHARKPLLPAPSPTHTPPTHPHTPCMRLCACRRDPRIVDCLTFSAGSSVCGVGFVAESSLLSVAARHASGNVQVSSCSFGGRHIIYFNLDNRAFGMCTFMGAVHPLLAVNQAHVVMHSWVRLSCRLGTLPQTPEAALRVPMR
jgi:hypothetical protein